ncbi:MAG TPA: hypothetical protein VKZ81_00530 [Pseudonocardia sp.]|jgi:hypothetical protein|uniref:hypothetical protein n=1 Tax=Pseudonocardia sp. TaxID=60912 RepID=UPI002B4B48BC|nr:hypothetical protein [Pseudonocardia sp.]HLU53918.1 hypothetical protein [Pseudonocardia sp.]
MGSSRVRSFLAGLLVANSAPHLASAVAGRQHLTPLAGRTSGPAVNAAWAALNLAAGAALLRWRRPTGSRWDRDLVSFEAGYLLFACWMAGTERLFPTNWDREGD